MTEHTSYVPPSYGATAFHCPTCGTYAHQTWSAVMDSGQANVPGLHIARCVRCITERGLASHDAYSIWHKEKMIQPDNTSIAPPNSDLNSDIIDDYNEARSILNKSPRGAAALLRLCIQKLCAQLGESGKNMHSDIDNLVKKELPVQIQQALDIVRVIGNNAVHPGQMDLKDDQETATSLFELVNIIADVMITEKKRIQQMYNSLPQTSLDAITDRARPKP
jgi:hypothetical protein